MTTLINLQDIYLPVRPDLGKLPGLIREILDTRNREILDVIDHFFSRNGKFLRPALVLLGGAAACSLRRKRADEREETALLHLAAATEIFHSATLIHDDIIDSAKIRRGIPTLNIKWGPQMAVLAGDFFHDRAMAEIFQYGTDRIIPLFLRTAGFICDGEVQELGKKNDLCLTEAEYLEIIHKKTASLLACSLKTGAYTCGMEEREASAIEDFGIHFGMAFQIVDDCLDFTGREHEFGKTLGSDVNEGVITLPVIELLVSSRREETVRILKGSDETKRFKALLELLKKEKAIEKAFDKACEFTRKAKASLEVLPECPARTSLEQLADYVLERNR